MNKIVAGFLFLALLISGCENSLEDFDPGFEGAVFFPLKTGNTWTYQLDSVIYDNNGSRVDTVSVLMREIITENFIDQSGQEAYRVSRSIFNETSTSWVVTDIWSASMDERSAYRTEENLRFTKLNFPVIEGKTWEGNAFIDEDVVVRIAGEPIRVYQNWGNYRYSGTGYAEQIGDLNFDNVCTVDQADLEDKITRRYSMEKYARGVGLIYRKMIILNTQQFESVESWEDKAEEGFILEQTLISFEEG